MQGPQTSRKASEVEVPATQNLTVHGFNLPQWESWFTETYHHITMLLPKVVLKKKTHISQLPWFFQEVPPTGERLKIFRQLPSKSSSFRAVEWQTSTSPWLSKPNANCSVLLFLPLSGRKSHHFVHYKKWSSENPPKNLVKFGALPPGATGEDPTSNGSYKDSRCRALRVGQRPLVQLYNAMEWSTCGI